MAEGSITVTGESAVILAGLMRVMAEERDARAAAVSAMLGDPLLPEEGDDLDAGLETLIEQVQEQTGG